MKSKGHKNDDDSPDISTIGGRIKTARMKARLSQAALADKCGWINGQGRIGNYEKNIRRVDVEDIKAIAEETFSDPIYLMFGEQENLQERIDSSDTITKQTLDLMARLDDKQKEVLQLFLVLMDLTGGDIDQISKRLKR